MAGRRSEPSDSLKKQSVIRYYREELSRPDWEDRAEKRDISLKQFADQIRQQVTLKGRSMLDVGCGWGDILSHLSSDASLSVGVEPDPERIRLSRLSFGEKKQDITLVKAVGEYLPFRSKAFDIVICNSVLEHTRNPTLVLKEIVRVTSLKGSGYISFPNYLFPREPHYGLVWFPFMPKQLARRYLRLRGRNPRFIEGIYYITPYLVIRTLQGLGVRIKNLLLDNSMKDLPHLSSTKKFALSLLGKWGNNSMAARALVYLSPSWAIMFSKTNSLELHKGKREQPNRSDQS